MRKGLAIVPSLRRYSAQRLLRVRRITKNALEKADFEAQGATGRGPAPLSLSVATGSEKLKGKVVLVVNTASKCAFTSKLEGLEALYREIRAQHGDFEMIDFPCNQFVSLDPGTDAEIQSFCQAKYDVTFPIMGKTAVNGHSAEPLWEWMKKSKPGLCGLKTVKWNFEKFLIGRDGLVKERWASTTKPEAIKAAVKA